MCIRIHLLRSASSSIHLFYSIFATDANRKTQTIFGSLCEGKRKLGTPQLNALRCPAEFNEADGLARIYTDKGKALSAIADFKKEV